MGQYQNENEWIKTEDGFEYKNIRKERTLGSYQMET